MATTLDFDEINRPEYEDWFDGMDISKDEIKRRVKAAIAFDNRIGATLAWIERTDPSVRSMYERFYRDYKDMLDDLDDADEEFLEQRAIQFAEEVTKSTQRHRGDLGGYWTSADRAAEIAKNEGGLVSNDTEYRQAKKAGKKYKTWNTMGDDKVRDTHDYLAGISVPVEDKFVTYDGDEADAPCGFNNVENNARCRCWLTFGN